MRIGGILSVALFFLAAVLFETTTVVEAAFDYLPDAVDASQMLIDQATLIDNLQTLFIGDVTLVRLEGIVWYKSEEEDVTALLSNSTSENAPPLLYWSTSVNGVVQASDSIDLSVYDRELPSSIDVGSIVVDQKQTSTITVTLSLDEIIDTGTTSNSQSYQTYKKGISLIPLFFILVMALTTQMVELSLFLGILIGSCIITGNLNDGFKMTLSDFLVGALADEGHVMIILFTVFLSGAVGMMQKSGGMLGFTRDIARVATTPRTGQYACMSVGILIFFDDYSNVLLAGETMRPLLDLLSVSREKLAFIVDGTSAPIASISPISSWVGFEVQLIQEAIDTLIERDLNNGGSGELTIPMTGFGVFLQSIRFSYYSFFMIVMLALLIGFQRDFGPMLVAERKVRVYDRTDGGPGAASKKGEEGGGEMEGDDENQPHEDQPLLGYNLLIPVILLVILIFVLLIETGTIEGEEQSFMDRIENSDSYAALLWGTMATAWLTMILYLLQITIPGTGVLAWPTPTNIYNMMPWRKEAVGEENQPRFLLSVNESIEAFLYGMGRIFLAIVVLTLAWGSGSVMESIGVDRLFASMILSGGIPFQLLPTLTFIIAMLMALATGTSWGTMAILFPLVLTPTYTASNGSAEIFYATTSAVMGGAVAGDHMSPISDTTVISALACDVTLIGHVTTQAPYVFWTVGFAILLGYIPVGYDAYPNIAAILIGFAVIAAFTFLICVPIISPTGRWDLFTRFCCSGGKEEMALLTEDCIKKFNGDTFIGENSDDENDGLEKEQQESAKPDEDKAQIEKVVSEESC